MNLNSLAIVRNATGKVVTFVRSDVPQGWQPPEGCTAVAASALPVGWQYEPDPAPQPVTDTLAGVPVTALGETLSFPVRLLATADIQVPDPDRGLVLRDDMGNDWVVAISNGSLTAVQISASPECSQAERKAKLAVARASGKVLVDAAKVKGKSKLKPEERLDVIEKMLGIVYS